MTFRSDATEGVWSPTQNVAVQTEANVVAIFFFHQCGFYDPTHHIRGCQKIIWNFALKGRALTLRVIFQPNFLILGTQGSSYRVIRTAKVGRTLTRDAGPKPHIAGFSRLRREKPARALHRRASRTGSKINVFCNFRALNKLFGPFKLMLSKWA